MPRTGFKSSSAIAIELDDGQAVFIPGETLTGYVIVERAGQEPPYGPSINLKLLGRVKTKYKVKTGNGTSITRGRVILFEESITLCKQVSCDNGEHAWRFSMTIPKASTPGILKRSDAFKSEPFYGFRPTKDADSKEPDVSTHKLPTAMYYFGESGMSGKTVEGYVEYALIATMGESMASHPIYIRQQSVPTPIENYKMRIMSEFHQFKGLKLLPQYFDKELSFGQKSRQMFRVGKTPRYIYSMKVEYPTVIQLDHPSPIPFRIHIIPDFGAKRTSICPDHDLTLLPPVKIISVEMSLKGEFVIRTPGSLWDSDCVKIHTYPFNIPDLPEPITIPVILPKTQPARTHSTPEHPSRPPPPVPESIATISSATLSAPFSIPDYISFDSEATTEAPNSPVLPSITLPEPLPASPLDQDVPFELGAYLSILLSSTGASVGDQRAQAFKREVFPSFATYNIVQKYRLEWKIKVQCADDKETVTGIFPVTVMAPSEEQETLKMRKLGTKGMKRNHDDLEQGVEVAVNLISNILQAVL